MLEKKENKISWQDEFKSALKTKSELEDFFERPFPSLDYSIFIPRHFAAKIKKFGPDSALAKQFLPRQEEKNLQGYHDPIGDGLNFAAPGLIHKYQNRVLFLPTLKCPIVCRYCFRKNEISSKDEIFKQDWQKTLSYIFDHPEVEEFIFSGGDPLILSDNKLEFYLESLLTKTKIKYIRFHSRVPIIMPSRINPSLSSLLKYYGQKFEKLIVSIHTNHLEEWDLEVYKAVERLHSRHIELLSQTVLLKGVNDSVEDLSSLFKSLSQFGLRPYYLHHPDQARGTKHFQMELELGRKIYAKLRNILPGWMIPAYVIDGPRGKVSAFNPESYSFSGNLIDKDGKIFSKSDLLL